MIRQITEQLKLPLQKAKKLTLKALCAVRGHRYPTSCFDNFSLVFCSCCGKEMADRTLDDILPRPEEDDWWNDPAFIAPSLHGIKD